jgi:hypothetical protein
MSSTRSVSSLNAFTPDDSHIFCLWNPDRRAELPCRTCLATLCNQYFRARLASPLTHGDPETDCLELESLSLGNDSNSKDPSRSLVDLGTYFFILNNVPPFTHFEF